MERNLIYTVDAETDKAEEALEDLKKKMEESTDPSESAMKFKDYARAVAYGMGQFKVAENILNAMTTYFSRLLSANREYTAEITNIRTALAAAAQPIYEALLPGLLAVLRVITAIANIVARVVNLLFGKRAEQSAANAKQLNAQADAMKKVGSAAKQAGRQLASFDEINRLEDNSTDGGAAGKLEIGEFDSEMSDLEVRLSRILPAVLAIAAAFKLWGISKDLDGTLGLLTSKFSGILFLIGGALLLYDGFKDAVENGINLKNLSEMLIGLLAIGVAFSILVGGWIPLLIVGLLALVLSIAYFTGNGEDLLEGFELTAQGFLDFFTGKFSKGWDEIWTGMSKIVDTELKSIKDLFGKLFTWIDEQTGGNWSETINQICEIFNDLVEFLYEFTLGDGGISSLTDAIFKTISLIIPDAWKEGINQAIGLLNDFINWVNDALSFDIEGFDIDLGFKKFSFGGTHMQLVNIPNIPLLAQGAVIPPNAPFMAMLGDQRNGTNLEAPADLIRQIVREEAGGNGKVEELLSELIQTVAGIKIGDDVIGKAATRFQSRSARAYGG